jgi:hypothetical protein
VSNVRRRLAEDVERLYDGRISGFLEEALAAERSVWGTCSHCHRKTEVSVPDWNARTRALQLALEQGYGKVPAGPNSEELAAIENLDELNALSDVELAVLAGGCDDFGHAREALIEAGWTPPEETP